MISWPPGPPQIVQASDANYGAIISFAIFGAGLPVSSHVSSYGSSALGKSRHLAFLQVNRSGGVSGQKVTLHLKGRSLQRVLGPPISQVSKARCRQKSSQKSCNF